MFQYTTGGGTIYLFTVELGYMHSNERALIGAECSQTRAWGPVAHGYDISTELSCHHAEYFTTYVVQLIGVIYRT